MAACVTFVSAITLDLVAKVQYTKIKTGLAHAAASGTSTVGHDANAMRTAELVDWVSIALAIAALFLWGISRKNGESALQSIPLVLLAAFVLLKMVL